MKKILRKIDLMNKISQRLEQHRLRSFKDEFNRFKSLSEADNQNRFSLSWEDRKPCLEDGTLNTGFDRHYIYHTAWAARVVNQINPVYHVDISSIIYFSSILSAFIPVKYFEYRPAELQLSNLTCGSADLLALPFEDEQVDSISCMHVIEHVGLGRYGDSLDPSGDLKAIKELKRVLSPGGSLLFVVPIGKPKVIFNAHRIYSYEQIRDYFSELELEEFALIPDNPKEGGLIYKPTKEIVDTQTYGCGCFWFRRKQ